MSVPPSTLGHTSPTVTVRAVRVEHGVAQAVEESIAEETPVTLAYNGIAHAVMMATPSDLEDFAVGFSITEGLVEDVASITRLVVVRYSRGIELQIETANPILRATARRHLSGRTGCGICGKQNVDEVLRALPPVVSDLRIDAAAIGAAMRELSTRQPINDATGAVHAAAWAHQDGRIGEVREDVGRHNALDKLVGARMRGTSSSGDGFVALTSRGSFELVQKAAVLGVPLVATVSAPTGLAIRVAHDVGITLAGFARDGRVTVYTHADRVSA